MRRNELELSIMWVRKLLPDDDQLIVIGSQSILGTFGEALLPEDALLSMEVDVLPLRDPDEQKADLIDVMLGRDSPFHERFGIYVDGVAPTTAKFAPGWLERTVPFVVGDAARSEPVTIAWCAHPADLVANKLSVGREKDMAFCRAVLRQRLVDPADVKARLDAIPELGPARRRLATDVLAAHEAPPGTVFAKVKPRRPVDLAPPTLADLLTVYDTDDR